MGFTVTLRPSGHQYEVDAGESVLSCGLRAGFTLPYSCRAGACKTCKSKVLKGEVDHGDVLSTFLSDEDRREGYTLLCQARAKSDLEIEGRELSGLEGIQRRIVPCRVVGLDKLAHDVLVLRVRLPMNENMLFVAGQCVDFLLEGGERRTYSIANAPAAEGVTELEFHLRHLPGGLFTERAFSRMKPRELLKFEGPFGTFFLREDSDKPMIFVAGGTGFAPIKSILLRAFARGLHERRPIHLYWGTRTRESLYMFDMVQEWADRYRNFKFVPVLSEPTAACAWTGRTGRVHEAIMDDYADLSGYQVYACGSPQMIESLRRDVVSARGMDPQEIFADEFLPASGGAAAIA